MSDPEVTISGGSSFSFLDVALVLAQASILCAAGSAVSDVAARCRTAALLLDTVTCVPPSADGMWSAPDPFPARPPAFGPPGLGPPGAVDLTMPPHVRAARTAAREDIAACADAAAGVADDLVRIGGRMVQAVGIYDAADAQAGRSFVDGMLNAVGILAGPLAPLGIAIGVGVGSVVHGGVAGQGWSLGRAATGTAALQAPLVSCLARVVGAADVNRPPWQVPGIGNGAAVLLGLTTAHRRGFRPDPSVRRVDVDPAVLGSPTDLSGALRGVDVLYGRSGGVPPSTVSVQKFAHGDGTNTWLVSVPGTQMGVENTVFGMRSNYTLMLDGVDQRLEADSVRAVLSAMEQAAIPADEDVMLVGHSQGGMIAATVAAGTLGTYRVTHVATAGSPMAAYPLPPGVRGTYVETRGEGVSTLDGAPNPPTSDTVTVVGAFPSEGGAAPAQVPHGVAFHREVLAAAQRVGDPGLERNLGEIEAHLDGTLVSTEVYEALLVPEDAGVTQAPAASGAPTGYR